MAEIKAHLFEIPLDDLANVENLTFEALHMDRDAVMEDFDDVYEDTREQCFSTFSCKAMFATFPIAEIREDGVQLEDGTMLASPFLARNLTGACDLALYAATVHGYEELAAAARGDVFESMFYNAWGIAFSRSCHLWIKKRIAEDVSNAGRFVGRGWTPGEDELEMSLQRALFELIDPSRIGITLTPSRLMSPTMSVNGIMGISDDPAIETLGTDIPSCH